MTAAERLARTRSARARLDHVSRAGLVERPAASQRPRCYAAGRDESDPCQAGTPGCSIDHDSDRGGCATW